MQKTKLKKLLGTVLTMTLLVSAVCLIPGETAEAKTTKKKAVVVVNRFSSVPAVAANGGKLTTDVYDYEYYKSTYADLQAAFGDNEKAYYNHYLTFGMAEGRSSAESFNVKAYRERYADLDAAFGDDWEAYIIHYLTYGMAEGRDASLGSGSGSGSRAVAASAPAASAPSVSTPSKNTASGSSNSSSSNTGSSSTNNGGTTSGSTGNTSTGSGSTASGSTGSGSTTTNPYEGMVDIDGNEVTTGTQIVKKEVYLSRDFVNAMNDYRVENGESELPWNSTYEEEALRRAKEISINFEHDHSNDVLGYYTEIIETGSFKDAEDMVSTFASSAGHNAAMLESYNESATAAICETTNANGYVRHYVVCVFPYTID